jgi:hypothetical protein
LAWRRRYALEELLGGEGVLIGTRVFAGVAAFDALETLPLAAEDAIVPTESRAGSEV